MDEKTLTLLSIDELLQQMMQETNKVTLMHKQPDNKKVIMEKLKYIQLLQKVIITKRANEIPGK